MRNNKGMTLIETIIALLILSTASIIMVTGFVTAFRVFSDSEQYKDNTNKEQTALINEEQKDSKINVDGDTEATYSITVANGQKPIKIEGFYKKATSLSDSKITLSSFEVDNSDDTKKAKNVYQNYLNMMSELKDYLYKKGLKGTYDGNTNSNLVKQYTAEWLKEKNIEVEPFEIITNMPKLYSLIYPNVKVNDLGDEIKKINSNFDASKYCYITPCLFMNKETSYTNFFRMDGYKNIFILLGDKAEKGDRPSKIYALYDNYYQSDDNTDVWWVPKHEVSTDMLENKTYDDIYNQIKEDSLKDNPNWVKVVTTKR